MSVLDLHTYVHIRIRILLVSYTDSYLVTFWQWSNSILNFECETYVLTSACVRIYCTYVHNEISERSYYTVEALE